MTALLLLCCALFVVLTWEVEVPAQPKAPKKLTYSQTQFKQVMGNFKPLL